LALLPLLLLIYLATKRQNSESPLDRPHVQLKSSYSSCAFCCFCGSQVRFDSGNLCRIAGNKNQANPPRLANWQTSPRYRAPTCPALSVPLPLSVSAAPAASAICAAPSFLVPCSVSALPGAFSCAPVPRLQISRKPRI